jgi:hypothetical protein
MEGAASAGRDDPTGMIVKLWRMFEMTIARIKCRNSLSFRWASGSPRFPCKNEFSPPDYLFSAFHGRKISFFMAFSCSLNMLVRKPAKEWVDMCCLKYIGLRASRAADSLQLENMIIYPPSESRT